MAFLGQDGGANGLPNMLFMHSLDFQPSIKFEAIVYVIGGGGSGARGGGNSNYGFSGGGAGATAISRLTLNTSVTYSVVIGDGGAGGGSASQAGGEAGDPTTFEGSDITNMSANGGAAGIIASGASAAGAAGGAAGTTGNLANIAGGASLASGATRQCSGGGAVGLFATGFSGVNVGKLASYEANAVGDGGTLHGSQGGGQYGDTDLSFGYHSGGDGFSTVMSPFSDLYTITNGDSRAYVSSTNRESAQNHYPANAQSFSSEGDDYERNATNRYLHPAGAFAGGNALYNSNDAFDYVYSGQGTLGGGSGAVLNGSTSGTSEGYASKGGKGAVLIFPQSMG